VRAARAIASRFRSEIVPSTGEMIPSVHLNEPVVFTKQML